MTIRQKKFMIKNKMKIEEKIINILRENGELESISISKELRLTYDSTAKHLKKMTEDGKIERRAIGKPWSYYYRLNRQKPILI